MAQGARDTKPTKKAINSTITTGSPSAHKGTLTKPPRGKGGNVTQARQ